MIFSGRQTKTGRPKSIYAYREKAVKEMKTYWKKLHKTITERTRFWFKEQMRGLTLKRTKYIHLPEKESKHRCGLWFRFPYSRIAFCPGPHFPRWVGSYRVQALGHHFLYLLSEWLAMSPFSRVSAEKEAFSDRVSDPRMSEGPQCG